MKKLWFVVCFMMLEKLLLPVVMVKSVSIDLQIIHYYKDSDQEIWAIMDTNPWLYS